MISDFFKYLTHGFADLNIDQINESSNRIRSSILKGETHIDKYRFEKAQECFSSLITFQGTAKFISYGFIFVFILMIFSRIHDFSEGKQIATETKTLIDIGAIHDGRGYERFLFKDEDERAWQKFSANYVSTTTKLLFFFTIILGAGVGYTFYLISKKNEFLEFVNSYHGKNINPISVTTASLVSNSDSEPSKTMYQPETIMSKTSEDTFDEKKRLLEELFTLKEDGALTEEEFQNQKKKILSK